LRIQLPGKRTPASHDFDHAFSIALRSVTLAERTLQEESLNMVEPQPYEQTVVIPPPDHASRVRTLFGTLKPGDRVRVKRQWHTTVEGTVEATGRRLTGLHTDRARDDHVYVDALRLKLDGGEVTTLTLDEFTDLEVVTKDH
jgi:hypothetical protein